jgi:hypothetical protein
MGDPHGGHTPAPAGAKASPVRLVILLAVLALLVGALGYDWFVAKPGVEAADKKLTQEARKNNAIGFDKELTQEERQKRLADSMLDTADVHRILNKSPAQTISGNGYQIEIYRWWGYLPLKRHYMSVVYLGQGTNLRYSTHYVNSEASAESLPGYERPSVTYEEPEGIAAATAAGKTGTNAIPPGKEGGKGGKGKGKGGKGAPSTGPVAEAGVAVEPPSETKTPEKEEEKGTKEGDKSAKGKSTEEKPEAKSDDKPAADKEGEKKKEDGDKPDEKKTDEKKSDEKKTDE